MKVFIPYDADLFQSFIGTKEPSEEQMGLIHDAVWRKLFHEALCDHLSKAVKLCRPGFEEEEKENDRLIEIIQKQESTIEFEVDGLRCETSFTREEFEKHMFDVAIEHWNGVAISNGKQYKKDPDPKKEEKNRKEAEGYAQSYSKRGLAIVNEIRKRVQYTDDKPMEKKYVLVMFPYPSGSGLHVGHAYNYFVMDSYCRWLRHQGHEVFQPFGFDAFGLPAELAAQKEGRDPAEVTKENINNFRGQIRRAHTKFEELLITSDPSYQKWSQWIFTQMLERGIAYKAERPEPYCPSCQTVLAKAQVTQGVCERCKTPVEQRSTPQWFLRITDYKQRLINNLTALDYPTSTKAQQLHWLDNLTDWCVSRQRKWGCPIPVEGETDTLDTFVDSSFYYVRYCDPTNEEQLCAPEKYQQVDLCVGGAEHACAHLIYARFVHMFLYDIGVVPVEEPFKKVVHQGFITKDGHKMSKSTGNVVDPDRYSSSALRMYLMFIGPYTEGGDWNDRAIVGVEKFLRRFEDWMSKSGGDRIEAEIDKFEAQLNKDTAAFKFNKVVSGFMTFLNQHKHRSLVPSQRARLKRLLKIYAPQ